MARKDLLKNVMSGATEQPRDHGRSGYAMRGASKSMKISIDSLAENSKRFCQVVGARSSLRWSPNSEGQLGCIAGPQRERIGPGMVVGFCGQTVTFRAEQTGDLVMH